MMIVCLIPAKSRSSRLKNKNFKRINGKRLVDFTIEKALKLKKIEEIYISSDKNSFYFRKDKIFFLKRKSHLCKKNSTMNEVILDFLKKIRKKKIKTVLLLQPTSPIRSTKQIENCLNIYKKKRLKFLFSGYKIDKKYLKSTFLDKNNKFKFLNQKFFSSNLQELPNLYMPNGSVFIFDVEEFLKKKAFSSDKIFCFEMKGKYNLDIDSYEDFKKAKKYL